MCKGGAELSQDVKEMNRNMTAMRLGEMCSHELYVNSIQIMDNLDLVFLIVNGHHDLHLDKKSFMTAIEKMQEVSDVS